MPNRLIEMIKHHGREKAHLVIGILCQTQVKGKYYVDYDVKSSQDLYSEEGQLDHLPEAEALLVSLVSHYRSGERRRLDPILTGNCIGSPRMTSHCHPWW